MLATLGLGTVSYPLGIVALGQQLKQHPTPPISSTATRVILIGSLDSSIIELGGLGQVADTHLYR